MTGIDTNMVSSSVAAAKTHLSEAEKLRLQKAAKDFEALFIGYMLKSMKSTVPESDYLGDGFGGDIMGSMFDTELAGQISKGSPLGIAEKMYQKLTGESLKKAATNGAASYTGHAQTKALPQRHQAKVSPQKTVPSQSMEKRIGQYQHLIDTSAQKNGVDSTLIKAVIATESAGHVYAQSSQDAKGLMQLIDSTASDMGVKNVWNPKENIEGGAKYLRKMLDTFDGNVELAVASYNAGPGTVQKHGGIPPIKETKEYVNRVMKYWNYFQQQKVNGDGK